jgi:hypothetical protein
LSRPSTQPNKGPKLLVNLYSVFGVPRPVEDELRIRQPVTSTDDQKHQLHVLAYQKENSSRSIASTKRRLWPGPRDSWSLNKKFWMFLLFWYIGCVFLTQMIHLFGAVEGDWPLQSGLAALLYLVGFAAIGLSSFLWVVSVRGKPAMPKGNPVGS